ncbi:MAG TPA: LysM domain-containing protein [Clostridia bacterium]|nr:LysM domain-containing protein [Clostridia bacterium]
MIRGSVGLLALALLAAACVPDPAARPGASRPATGPSVRPATPEPTPPGPTPTLTFVRPTATPLPTFFAYRVRTGDTLISIARRFETTPQSIGYWNRATYPTLDPESSRYNPNDIRVGWTLLIIPRAEVDDQDLTPPPSSPEPPGG